MEGRFNGGFFTLPVLGAYTWGGLFSEFYGMLINSVLQSKIKTIFNIIK